jgi:hypothetical protein
VRAHEVKGPGATCQEALSGALCHGPAVNSVAAAPASTDCRLKCVRACLPCRSCLGAPRCWAPAHRAPLSMSGCRSCRGTYHPAGPSSAGGRPRAPGAQVRWSAAVSAALPVFMGGGVQGASRRAVSELEGRESGSLHEPHLWDRCKERRRLAALGRAACMPRAAKQPPPVAPALLLCHLRRRQL